jgi:uncharacterized pyridoxamine 5'-phosphate oxidase family protein
MTREQAIQFIRRARFGYLATTDGNGGVSVRPVAIDTVYGDDLYFFTFVTTAKVGQIAANPRVAVVWSDVEALSQVRMTGIARREEDASVIERFKADNPMVQTMLPPGAEELFALYRVEPQRVQAAEGLVPYSDVTW